MNDQDRYNRGSDGFPLPDDHLERWPGLAVDYQDGRLDPERRLVLENHLGRCPACRRLLAEHAAGVRALETVTPAVPPAGLEQLVLSAVAKAQAAPPSPARKAGLGRVPPRPQPGLWDRLLPQARALLPAAAVVLLIGIAVVTIPFAQNGDDMTTTTAAGQAATAVPNQESAPTSGSGVGGAADSSATESTEAFVAGATTTAPAGGTLTSGTERRDSADVDLGQNGQSVRSPYVVLAGSQTASSAYTAALLNKSLGIAPAPSSLWLGGPTFAFFLPRVDLASLLGRLDRAGLDLTALGHRTATPGSPMAVLLHAWPAYPELAAVDVVDPWGKVFVTRGWLESEWRLSRADLVLVIVAATD